MVLIAQNVGNGLAQYQRRMMMPKYTDDQIADACMECVNDWDTDTLLQFAYDEMFHHYTEVASTAGLADFMKENENGD